MFELTKEFRFEASHQLPNHDGKCQRLHGHSWRGHIVLRGDELQTLGPQQGMLMDYGRVKAILTPFVEEKLDHHHLNETTGLENPTSEMLARWIYTMLEPHFGGLLHAVKIEETCTSSCIYSEGNKERSTRIRDALRTYTIDRS